MVHSGIPRGTTPTHIFEVDVDLTSAVVMYISYKQFDKVVLEKTLEDITVTATQLTVRLTQEETLLFKDGLVEIQIRARLADDSALKSDVIKTDADKLIKDGVI